jgi:hypothetical protein
MFKQNVKSIVIAVTIAFLANMFGMCILKLVWGQQMTWIEVLIMGPFFTVVTLAVVYFQSKKNGQDK